MIVALDPGVTTGLACYEEDFHTKYRTAQLAPFDVWVYLEGCLEYDKIDIVCESFQYRRLPSVNLEPVEVIGMVKLFHYINSQDTTLTFQTPHQRKFFTDDRLKEYGLWEPGKPHAMDAMRHLLVYQKRFVPSK